MNLRDASSRRQAPKVRGFELFRSIFGPDGQFKNTPAQYRLAGRASSQADFVGDMWCVF